MDPSPASGKGRSPGPSHAVPRAPQDGPHRREAYPEEQLLDLPQHPAQARIGRPSLEDGELEARYPGIGLPGMDVEEEGPSAQDAPREALVDAVGKHPEVDPA